MKLLIDTNWFAMIQDLPYKKQKDVLCAILDYPNKDSDTNLWKKIIKPALEKEKIIYENKCENLKRANTQKTNKKITDSDTVSNTDSDTVSPSNSNSNINNIYNNNSRNLIPDTNTQDNNILSGNSNNLSTTHENEEDRTLEIQFNAFWEAFPKQRKAGKTKPRQKFYQIVKSKQATAEQLIKAAEEYAKSDTVIRGFAKEPYSWLLNERYLCDYSASVSPMPQMSFKEMKQMQNEIELEKIRKGER